MNLNLYLISAIESQTMISGTVADVQKIFDASDPKHKHEDYDATIYRKVNGEKGFVELYRSKDGDHIGTVAIEVNPNYRRQGVASRLIRGAIGSMKSLGITRLEWYCKRSNIASQKLAEKSGFHIDKDLCNDKWLTYYYGSTEK